MGATSKKLMPRGIFFATLVGCGPAAGGIQIVTEVAEGVGATPVVTAETAGIAETNWAGTGATTKGTETTGAAG